MPLRAGRAADDAAAAKLKKYDLLAQRLHFVPVGAETSGVWEPSGLRFLREIGVRVAATTGEKRASAFLLQWMCLAIQRAKVVCVLGTLPRGKEFEKSVYFDTCIVYGCHSILVFYSRNFSLLIFIFTLTSVIV